MGNYGLRGSSPHCLPKPMQGSFWYQTVAFRMLYSMDLTFALHWLWKEVPQGSKDEEMSPHPTAFTHTWLKPIRPEEQAERGESEEKRANRVRVVVQR